MARLGEAQGVEERPRGVVVYGRDVSKKMWGGGLGSMKWQGPADPRPLHGSPGGCGCGIAHGWEETYGGKPVFVKADHEKRLREGWR